MVERANPPRINRLVKLIGPLLLALAALLGVGWALQQWTLDRPLPLVASKAFEIRQGEGFQQVLRRLAAEGIVGNPFWLAWQVRMAGLGNRLRYGEYEIPPGATPRQLLDMLSAGTVRQHAVTLVEGWTFAEVMDALNRHPDLAPVAMGRSPEEIMALLGAPRRSPEGRFFPDTYFVTRGTSDLDVLRRAHGRTEKVLRQEWDGRADGLPYVTPDDALVMASIVEKETARADERRRVAGVFTRRLQKGMKLQTDPTVIYGMGALYQGNIKRDDLRRDTPYNTYTRSGLPPTPIAMPSLASLHAALHPDDGASLYFVGRGDGSHVFSDTLAEHNRAVRQYQKH